jgi:hypothetical protein
MSAALTLTPGKPTYAPGEVITIHADVSGVTLPESIAVTGAVELPDGVRLPATTTVTIGAVYALDPIAGYTIEQTDATATGATFTLTPTA